MPKLIAGNHAFECKLVLFDKDGTLIDLREVLMALARARYSSIRKLAGDKFAAQWEEATGVNIEKDRIDPTGPFVVAPRKEEMLLAAGGFYLNGWSWSDARQLATKAYDEADAAMKPPFGSVLLEGVGETLKKLKQEGFKLAVASTDTHERIVRSFSALKILDLFDAIVSDDDVAEGKPAPDMIECAMRKTGCVPRETVMVGDSVFDLIMGKNVRVKACIGVLTGFTSKDKLEKHADLIVKSVAELHTA